jgi:hypothetical protein
MWGLTDNKEIKTLDSITSIKCCRPKLLPFEDTPVPKSKIEFGPKPKYDVWDHRTEPIDY